MPELVADHRDADPEAYAACCDALAAFDLRERLAEIAVPTLLVAGREDPATPPAHLREIADAVPGAALVELPGASHLAPAQCPEAVLTVLRAHLDGGAKRGMEVRREVLGDAHVDRAQARQNAFTARYQDFISRYAWGEIWTDPTLSRRERSMITLTALVAHGHYDELAMHVRAAWRNGLTPEEIGAVLLQTAVYCGSRRRTRRSQRPSGSWRRRKAQPETPERRPVHRTAPGDTGPPRAARRPRRPGVDPPPGPPRCCRSAPRCRCPRRPADRSDPRYHLPHVRGARARAGWTLPSGAGPTAPPATAGSRHPRTLHTPYDP